jgi:hypothetical protein
VHFDLCGLQHRNFHFRVGSWCQASQMAEVSQVITRDGTRFIFSLLCISCIIHIATSTGSNVNMLCSNMELF